MAMMSSLTDTITSTPDPPDQPPPDLKRFIYTGKPGRPKLDIRKEDLNVLSVGRTPRTTIAAQYDCSARTVRNRLLEFQLSKPGPPVYEDIPQSDGSYARVYRPGVCSDLSLISDEELDQLIRDVYERFPSFGRRMIDGFFMQDGYRIPRGRLLQAYDRVIGPPANRFGPHRLVRRAYSVPGPNSLWHHDGQHGMFISLWLQAFSSE
jgi:hypothetical protein